MGNCLKGGCSLDDLSLINDANNAQQGDTGISSNIYSDPTESSQTISQSQPRQSTSLPFYYSAPCTAARSIMHLGEEEQIQIAKRIGLIQHLPTGIYEESSSEATRKVRECVICMIEFTSGDNLRFLPCMHTYHVKCIDDWLMRSFICPSCMEPVDAALLSTFQ